MVRLSWVKGLLGVFDFVGFIQEHNYSPVIKDIYGKEHDVIEEEIQIIFTKAKFKMAKHFHSWEQIQNMVQAIWMYCWSMQYRGRPDQECKDQLPDASDTDGYY